MDHTRIKRTTVLFLCTGNSCRSQMAEGWARHLLADQISAYSAGLEKHGLNPLAVRAMREAGVDISTHQSNTIDELPIKHFDLVITLCGHAHETCPFFPGKTIHRGFEDPPKLALHATSEEEKLAHYRRVRDEIRTFNTDLPGVAQSILP
jgi:arsenate reductase